jgi:CRISPR-associated endonuclease/helicase Cas3
MPHPSPPSIAHSRVDAANNAPGFHLLHEHLEKVADLAAAFGLPFHATSWLKLAGLWHDLGKYRPGFQRYIRQTIDAHIEGRAPDSSKTHSAAGALWAHRWLSLRLGPQGAVVSRVLQYIIAGHHAGLDNWENNALAARLTSANALTELEEALSTLPPHSVMEPGVSLPKLVDIPTDDKGGIPGRFALWVRMLFSCLVDADFLDTERFMDQAKSDARSGTATLSELADRFDQFMSRKQTEIAAQGLDTTPVNQRRALVLRQCRDKALNRPGSFTLTVPTGGGKTLSSLAFALTHAQRHRKRRIIYAIPYTSIIEQTADIFRGILGDDQVVEHHSNAEADPKQENLRSRLACENWDAPVIVTTNVQLFESLFARRTSRCRKLHNLVDSVLVLDEAQLLPVEFLQPVVDVLRLLVKDYGVTVLFCTATQPTLTRNALFDARRALRGYEPDEVIEVIDDVAGLYADLKRVRVNLPPDLNHAKPWPDLAHDMARDEAMLAIVNRRADARELYELLKRQLPTHRDGLWHLSALMCPQHRSDAIADIKQALSDRRQALACGDAPKPVRVVSTNLIEAGVDLDMPVVWRAMAGLDAIAQAAGRCNREGRLSMGEVHVFVPPTQPPPGLLRHALATCKVIWHERPEDPLAVALFEPYFRKLYGDAPSLDKHGIVDCLRMSLDRKQQALPIRFRDASDSFKLIDNEDGATVIVRYQSPRSPVNVDALIGQLEKEGPQRWLMRKLQRYGVTLYQRDIDRLVQQGDVRELAGIPGLYVQHATQFYDQVMGANAAGAPGDPASYVC